jgi:hypothetical protein
MAAGCKKAPSSDKPAQAAAPEATPSPPAGWKIESHPWQLMCGEKPLALPAPVAAAPRPDRPFRRAEAIKVCQDQPAVAAVCGCLTKSLDRWGSNLGLSPAVECEAQAPLTGDAQVVEVSSKPADDSATSGGEAFVFVARHGSAWSPVAVIEYAPDVDMSVTPKASHRAKVDRVDSHGGVFWIESHHEAQEKEMGESKREGEAHGTVCFVGAAPYCGRVTLGEWTFALTTATSECTVGKAATYAATLDAVALTVRVEHGSDTSGAAGRYTF